MDDLILAASRQRGGYLFRSDLIDLGLRDDHIAQAVRAGVLERLRHGTYVPRGPSKMTAEERHRVLAYSIADKLGPSVALSHHSAALLHAGTVWGLDLSTVHVTRIGAARGRNEAGITFHAGRVLSDDDLCVVDGRQCVAADRAVIESSTLASVEAGMVTASFTLRAGACSLVDLHARMSQCARWRGMLRVRLAVSQADERCESVGEVRSLYVFGAHRVPRPEVQHEILRKDGSVLARCDFGWEDYRHVGEFDGAVKYGRLNPHEGSETGQVLVREKRREDSVRAENYGMSRWMWPELDHRPDLLARRILGDLDRSRRLYRRNAVTIV